MFVGIDIGGTSIKYGLVTLEGQIVSKGSMPTRYEPDELLADLETVIKAYQSDSKQEL